MLNKFIKKTNIRPPFVFQKPYIPWHLKVLFSTTASSRAFYKEYIKVLYNQEPLCQERWNNILNDTLGKPQWVNLYRASFYVISDSYTKWFQYRIINQILGTRQYLKKIGLTDTETCWLCHSTSETLKHLLAECPESNELWKNVTTWVKNKIGINLRIGNVEKILGYHYCDKNFTPVNFLLLHTRKYIFWCARKNHSLNFYFLQSTLKQFLFEEETLAKLNNTIEKFNYLWDSWKILFWLNFWVVKYMYMLNCVPVDKLIWK